MTKPLWIGISLISCDGQVLASWNYDEVYPVIPPQFTYPNESDCCPYIIEFRHVTWIRNLLPANVNLNHAIYEATQKYVQEIKSAKDE